MFTIAIAGIEGFGLAHVRRIAELARAGKLRCVAFADPGANPTGESYTLLESLGAVRYPDDATLLAERPDVEGIVLATPLALHKPMAIRALRTGRHVLVEKPPSVAVQDIDEMAEAAAAAGKICAVNFQNTSGRAFRRALELLRGGAIGRARRIVGVGMWKRTDRYYSRNDWAGKLTLNGQLVLDGTLMNPFAHLLQNALLLGEAAEAEPAELQAELYRAHDIEGDDTSCLRLRTSDGGPDICLYTTLCHAGNAVPFLEATGDEGVLRWDYANRLELRAADGATTSYDGGEEVLLDNMYLNWIDSAAGRATPYCAIDGCRPFLSAVNGALLSSGAVHPIPEQAIERRDEDGDRATSVPGLPELFRTAAERGALLSELGVPWAVPGRPFSLDGFREFRWGGR